MDLVYSCLVALVACVVANRLFGRLHGLWPIGQIASTLAASVAIGALLSSVAGSWCMVAAGFLLGVSPAELTVAVTLLAAIAALCTVRRAARRSGP